MLLLYNRGSNLHCLWGIEGCFSRRDLQHRHLFSRKQKTEKDRNSQKGRLYDKQQSLRGSRWNREHKKLKSFLTSQKERLLAYYLSWYIATQRTVPFSFSTSPWLLNSKWSKDLFSNVSACALTLLFFPCGIYVIRPVICVQR